MATPECNPYPGESTNHDSSAAKVEWRRELLKRIVASKQFRSSPRLVELFSYIADASLRDAPEDVTEQQIGQNIFGRKAGYNCSEDSIVRSEVRQLRLKLNVFFAEEGATEESIIEIPKGRYLLEFRPRASRQGQERALKADTVVESRFNDHESETDSAHRSVGAKTWTPDSTHRVLWVALIVMGLAVSVLAFKRHSGDPGGNAEVLWEPFLSGNQPIVVYSNAMLRGTSQGGIQDVSDVPSESSAIDSSSTRLDDSYTGVGEVAAVHALDRVFAQRGMDFRLRRSLLLSWEEARDNNIIVIGSTAQNKAMKSLPTTKDFTFGNPKDGIPYWGIVNHNAKPNEKPFYTGGDHAPQIEDFAIIALLQGPTERHWILLLGGLGTHGTQAAAEFAMSEKGAGRLQELLGPAGRPHPFEAVLHFNMVGEVPIDPEIVAFHKR